jgi:hypothetical protein
MRSLTSLDVAPNTYIYPPGPAWLLVQLSSQLLFFFHWWTLASPFRYILGDGIPSNGTKVMIGTGANPPSSVEAYKGAIKYSKEAQVQYQNMNLTSSGGG